MKKQIIALIHNTNKKKAIEDICREFSVEFKAISPSDINNSLAEILGLPLLKPIEHPLISEKPKAPAMFIAPELLIFNNVDDNVLDAFLEEYKSRNIEPIALKGVVTPANLTWSVYEIIKEYEEESGLK